MEDSRWKTFIPSLLLALGVVGVGLWIAVAASRKPERTQPIIQGQPSQLVPAVPPKAEPVQKTQFPYPECEVCLQWITKNIADPKSMEIIEWERIVYKGDEWAGAKPGMVRLIAKVRAKNQFGAMAIGRTMFFLENGVIISADPIR